MVQSPLGNVAWTFHIIARNQVTPDDDLVLLTCKTYDVDQVIAAMAPAVGEHKAAEGTALPLTVDHTARAHK